MKRVVLDQNGTAKQVVKIDDDGNFTMQSFEDVTELVNDNKSIFNDNLIEEKEGMRLRARLPLTLYHELHKKKIIQNPKRFKAWLNHPDNRHFLCSPGRF